MLKNTPITWPDIYPFTQTITQIPLLVPGFLQFLEVID